MQTERRASSIESISNKLGVMQSSVEELTEQHAEFLRVLSKRKPEAVAGFITEYCDRATTSAKKSQMLASASLDILESFREKHRAEFEQEHDYIEHNKNKGYEDLSAEEYAVLFKYCKVSDFLKSGNSNKHIHAVVAELESLPPEFAKTMRFNPNLLKNPETAEFCAIYGLKNIVEFDKENDYFFSKENGLPLSVMYEAYVKDEKKFIENGWSDYGLFLNKAKDEKGLPIGGDFSKEDFYEVVRRMLINGVHHYPYRAKPPTLENMTQELKRRNPDLVLADDAPPKLKKAFLNKHISERDLGRNPDWIPFLKGKNLHMALSTENLRKSQDKVVELHSVLIEKFGADATLDLFAEYSSVIRLGASVYDNPEKEAKYSEKFFAAKTIEEVKQIYIEKAFDGLTTGRYPVKLMGDEHHDFKETYPKFFIDMQKGNPKTEGKPIPEDLEYLFYNGSINPKVIAAHPEYVDFLEGKDFSRCFEKLSIYEVGEKHTSGYISPIELENYDYKTVNAYDRLVKDLGFEEAMKFVSEYSSILHEMQIAEKFAMTHSERMAQYELAHVHTLPEIKKKYAKILSAHIIEKQRPFPDNLPKEMREIAPEMFLPENAPADLQAAFYGKTLTLSELQKDPEKMKWFEKTDISLTFSRDCAFIADMYPDVSPEQSNALKAKIALAYEKITDWHLKAEFQDFIKQKPNLNAEKVEELAVLLKLINETNASELQAFKSELAEQILYQDNPIQKFKEIERMFLTNDMPTIGKLFSVFEILHPHDHDWDLDSPQMSPKLKRIKQERLRKAVVFSDLAKSSLGSNSKSIRDFLDVLEKGNDLYLNISSGNLNFDNLPAEDKKVVYNLRDFLKTANKVKNRHSEEFEYSDSPIADIERLETTLVKPEKQKTKNALADSLVYEYAHFFGVKTVDEARSYISSKITTAHTRGVQYAESGNFDIRPGDLVKGVNSQYLKNILGNGILAKEFLGESADSDRTPLDTDLVLIKNTAETMGETIGQTEAKNYGSVYFVLKGDDRFNFTRKKGEQENAKHDDLRKMEVFYSGVCDNENADHYGIRTGFASSEIDFIVTDSYNESMGLDIAINGFYIPVVDGKGNLLFSEKDYSKLRSQMAGLSELGGGEFVPSKNLYSSGVQEISAQVKQNENETKHKRSVINHHVQQVIKELGFELKTAIDGDLSTGSIELIDTGSTGRGTNKPGEGDFDFMMRLDNSLMLNDDKLEELKEALLNRFGEEHKQEVIGTGDFRLKSVKLADPERPTKTIEADIDISFVKKDKNVTYSTDMALSDRMASIRKQHPDEYEAIVANILLAKQTLKKAEAYKPNRGEVKQGGLGGVGVENWVLQHGGSFYDAAQSFLEASNGRTFEEFKKVYKVWDFGENHMAEEKGLYPHDNFVECNMSEEGYVKMRAGLLEFVKQQNKSAVSKKPNLESFAKGA